MSPRPYVYERQTEYWTSRQIEEFFLDAGFELIVLPITQLYEAYVPADFIFFDKKNTKLFGFQYKALYGNGQDHWNLNMQQHMKLKKYNWIYYCMSELKNYSELRLSLHKCKILTANFEYKEKY
jgi:hypothetical protein